MSSAPARGAAIEEDDEEGDERTLNVLSIIGLAAAAVALLLALMSSDTVDFFVDKPDSKGWKLPKGETTYATTTMGSTDASSSLTREFVKTSLEEVPKASD